MTGTRRGSKYEPVFEVHGKQSEIVADQEKSLLFPMNKKIEAKQRRGRVAAEMEEATRKDSPKIKPNVFGTEDVLITDDQTGDGYSNTTQTTTEDSTALFIQKNETKEEEEGEETEEEFQTTNLDALLAAWWKYKRENKQKKKRRKLLKIYRDENYWNNGRYTDDEDFNYYES